MPIRLREGYGASVGVVVQVIFVGLIRGVIDGKEMIEAVWKSASSEKFDFGMDTCVETSVLNMYIKCGAMDFAQKVFCRTPNPSLFCWNSMIYGYSKYGSVKKALELFAKMPERDTVSWNTMISILSQHGFGAKTLNTFLEMWNQGFRPNSMTYASVLSACTSIYDLEWGAHLHARIVRMEPRLDVYAVSWTSLIGGVAQAGFQEEALDISIGEQLHAHTITRGLDSSVPVANALVTMYAKCGDVWKANHAFELMPIRDIISWTAMITAFLRP
ncbi:Pentatricopeptide repeat-containing protein [Vitis vinifera]|uniref:Pentatricopeptide repeat-containing protein n=1 Tax=Vitis vinifera TaxID=29760 RepID=A0A438G7T1_VITVI|nr:Pentatricopeptide repeat-containing protein [Vitis vinifera]